MSDMDLGVPGALTHRQRRRFNELWSQGWNRPLSADQIRHPVWSRFLADPVVEIGSGDGLLARTVRSNRVISIDQSRIGLQQTLPSAWFLASVPTLRSHALRACTTVSVSTSHPRSTTSLCGTQSTNGGTRKKGLVGTVHASGWKVEGRIPLFGFTTTPLMYFSECLDVKALRRAWQSAQHGNQHSGLALVCSIARNGGKQ